MKSQEYPHRQGELLYPIPSGEISADFGMLSDFDDNDLTFLKEDYLHHLADADPTHFLIALEARQYLQDIPILRRAYRVGVIAGSIILRERLHTIGQNPHEVFKGEFQREIDWPAMKMARFALEQYFAANVDTTWIHQDSSYAPHGELLPTNDWMTVGMGDVLRVGDVAEAHFTEQKVREPFTLPLKPEQLLTDELAH